MFFRSMFDKLRHYGFQCIRLAPALAICLAIVAAPVLLFVFIAGFFMDRAFQPEVSGPSYYELTDGRRIKVGDEKVFVDILNNEELVIEGKVFPMEELDLLIQQWMNEGKMISLYVEPKEDRKPKMEDLFQNNDVATSGLNFSPRLEPQEKQIKR